MAKVNGSGQAATLSPEQLELLLDSAPSPAQRFLWAVMRFSGSRVTETLRLEWSAIHAYRIVFIAATTKTRKTREVRMAPRLQDEAQRYRGEWSTQQGREPKPRDLVFPCRFGGT